MKASELRYGNMVYENWAVKQEAGPMTIEQRSLVVDLLTMVRVDNNDPTIEPIPLSEEWLLKFGFEIVGNEWTGAQGMPSDYYKHGEFVLSQAYWVVGIGRKFDNPIKHVHELQNIYFCLTSEELTITE